MSEPKTEARLSPESFARGPDVASAVGAHQPPVSQGPSGNTYVDQGGICEGKSGGGCILNDQQRGRLSQLFFSRMTSAENNYKHAIANLRVDQLLKKEEDASWLVLLILDVVTFHLASSFRSGLTALKTDALSQIDQMGARLALRFEEVPLRAQLSREALKLAGPDEIKGVVKFAVDRAAKATASAMKSEPAGKAANVSYLTKLQSDAGIGFQAVREGLPATLNDLEMIAVTDSLDAAKQTIEMFTTVLSAKLSRFESSGVTEIRQRTRLA
ncbi:MAG: hypothetical protein IPQ07_05680 [Myxococcales bacterium]|nr:hypothetical protein [Myxococcales bacterium]